MGICRAGTDDQGGMQQTGTLLASSVPDETRQFVSGR